MNPLTTAIERAVAVATNRATLESEFQRQIEALEFSSNAQAVILPVPRLAALAWARGELTDLDLALRAGPPECIWGYLLPSLGSLRAGIDAARCIYDGGARLFITHTRVPLVLKHWLRYGCTIHFHAADGGKRLVGGENMVRRYFHSL